MEKIYDCLIIGGGVAGMTAAIYAKRSGKDVAIIEKNALGGQILQLERIENFPSQMIIDGLELSKLFKNQIGSLQVEILRDDIERVDFSENIKRLFGKKTSYCAKNIIIASGLSNVELGLGEKKFLGQGVSYCAVCDGNFYKNQVVCVASDKGSGIRAAKYLSNIASKVYLLDMNDISNYARASKDKNLEIFSSAAINKVDVSNNEVCIEFNDKKLKCAALFVELGKRPSTILFKDWLKLDERGYIITDEKMQTSVQGVFAVGDVRNGQLKQIVTACGDGAIAGTYIS